MSDRDKVSETNVLSEDIADKIDVLEQEYGRDKLKEIIDLAKQKEILEKKFAKKVKLEKESNEIKSAISAGNYNTKKDKVAFILNNFPDTRDSDITLSIKYWEVFQPEIYDGQSISKEQLFNLERLTSIARIRAKIQNEFGLYKASTTVRRRRKIFEEEVREAVGADIPQRSIFQIYADETGKNEKIVVIGSVWFLDGFSTVKLFNDIKLWKEENNWGREFHFSKIGRRDVPVMKKFIDFLRERSSYMSFKAIGVDRTGSSRPIEDIVLSLYRYLILSGIKHEIEADRADLPRSLSLTIDKEDSIDAITIADLKRTAQEQISVNYLDQILVSDIDTVDSKKSFPVQIADLISGALNRRLNHSGDRNYKDDLADYIIDKFSIALNEEDSRNIDSAVLLSL